MTATDCPGCGKEIESAEDVKKEGEVVEMETEDDGSLNLYGNNKDLFLCEGCSKPLGFGK